MKTDNKLYCLQCGNELTGYQKKFCSSSCAATYNNLRRKPRTKESRELVSNILKKYYNDKNKTVKQNIKQNKFFKSEKAKRFCLCCGKELNSSQKKFCSPDCSFKYKKEEHYKYYLEHQDEFCRPNYTPKFKKEFIKEQGGVCAICGIKPEWNNNQLVFILDHIDGDASNNHRNNLRCICPNCDSQLDTYKSKNKKSTRRNYWRERTIKLSKTNIEN